MRHAAIFTRDKPYEKLNAFTRGLKSLSLINFPDNEARIDR
jgi:hypothetical protein